MPPMTVPDARRRSPGRRRRARRSAASLAAAGLADEEPPPGSPRELARPPVAGPPWAGALQPEPRCSSATCGRLDAARRRVAGEVVKGASGRKGTWRPLGDRRDGTLRSRRAGRRPRTARSWCRADGVWLAEVVGPRVLYVNGVPYGGDVYGHGITKVPVPSKKGVEPRLRRRVPRHFPCRVRTAAGTPSSSRTGTRRSPTWSSGDGGHAERAGSW